MIKMRIVVAAVVALVLSVVSVRLAYAYITLNGMVPVGRAGVVILQAHQQSANTTDTLKFKFSAPSFNAGTPYVLSFCIGPAANPCAQPIYSVQVPGGEERLAVVPSSVFANNVLAVGQGTTRPVPYSVTME